MTDNERRGRVVLWWCIGGFVALFVGIGIYRHDADREHERRQEIINEFDYHVTPAGKVQMIPHHADSLERVNQINKKYGK